MNKSVILYANLAPKGGVETQVFHLSQLLRRQGAEVTIASLSAVNREWRQLEDLGIRFVTTGLPYGTNPRIKNIAAALLWPLCLRPRSYDVVCGFGLGGFLPFMRLFLSKEGRLLFDDPADGTARWKAHARMVRRVDAIIAMSPRCAVNLSKNHSDSPLIRSIPFLTCMGLKLREMLELRRPSGNVLRIACFGTLVSRKNPSWLIELWPDLNLGSAKLTFYGDGPEKVHLLDLIRRHGLSNDISLRGPYNHQEDLSRFMSQSDMVVLPSQSEGLPLVLLEAMAHGVPFVATDVGGVADLAEDNPDVLVVPPTPAGIKSGLEIMARKIRSGEISPRRLQQYYQERYSPEVLGPQWVSALLEPEKFWA